MLAVLSPAKKLNFAAPASGAARHKLTTPELLKETKLLAESTRLLSSREIKELMSLSDNLADLNFDRFQNFDATTSRPKGSKQAALAFNGDTYTGLTAGAFSEEEMAFAQDHLGIFSGLYGLLRPLDAIQPHRLEMGTHLKTPRGKSLYEFWGDRVAVKIDKRLKKLDSDVLINLASNEYFSVLPRQSLKARVITPVFKEIRSGKAKIISFSAKRARGRMARFIVKNRITDPSLLKKFKLDGYRFQKDESDDEQWLFLRDQPS